MPDPTPLDETPRDPSDARTWRDRAEAAERERETLRRENARLRQQVDRLRRARDAARRAGVRQAAPFATPLRPDPKRPGRTSGRAYGPDAHRRVPPRIHEHHDASLPTACPACQAAVLETSMATQYQEELPVARDRAARQARPT